MLLRILCTFLFAALAVAVPTHMTDDQYIDKLLRQELQKELGYRVPRAQDDSSQYEETFGQPFHDRDNYEQTAEDLRREDQQRASGIEQFEQNPNQLSNIEQLDSDPEQNENEQLNDDRQTQSGHIEQLDQQDNGIEQFDQDDTQTQSSGAEELDRNEQVGQSPEDDQGIEQMMGQNVDQANGDSENPDNNVGQTWQSGQSADQDRIDQEAIDRLYSDKNVQGGEGDLEFNDVFGNNPAVTEYVKEEVFVPPPTKKPSWFRKAWNKTKEKAKNIYHHIKHTVG